MHAYFQGTDGNASYYVDTATGYLYVEGVAAIGNQFLPRNGKLEFIPAEEIKKIAPKMVGLHVTDSHPKENGRKVFLDPSNTQNFSRGVVTEAKYDSSDHKLNVKIQIHHPSLIKRVLKDKNCISFVGLSHGYLSLNGKGGVFNNKKYDVSLHSLKPNHLAVLKSWEEPNAGPEACMKFDSKEVNPSRNYKEEIMDKISKTIPSFVLGEKKFDSFEMTVNREDKTSLDRLVSQMEAFQGSYQVLSNKVDSLMSDNQSLKDKNQALESDLSYSMKTDSKEFHDAIKEYNDLYQYAIQKDIKEKELEGKSSFQIKEAIVKTIDPSLSFSSDEALDGAFITMRKMDSVGDSGGDLKGKDPEYVAWLNEKRKTDQLIHKYNSQGEKKTDSKEEVSLYKKAKQSAIKNFGY